MPRSGFDLDGVMLSISLSTCKVLPGQVGLGHVISVLAPIRPPANGTLSVSRRMVMAAVCQPLAASEPKNESFAASSSVWNGCGSKSAAKRLICSASSVCGPLSNR